MADIDISSLSVASAQDALRRGDFTSVELTQAVLDAIAAKDGAIGAYLTVDADGALAGAAEADARRRAGEDRDLLGIPVAMKDIFNVKGQPCTCASRILEGYVAPFDATVVARLRAEGAIPCGRVNMDEFAMGASTEHSAFQVTRNPVAPDRVPGGSSGGSAAAVAGGLALASLGTDTGGSIRQPASFCGCVGLKPSYGRVSRYGVTAFASSLDQVGPIARDVEDAAILLQAIAGADPHDQTCLDRPVPDYRAALPGASVEGLRIGVPKEYFVEGTDPQVMALVRAAIEKAAAAGARVEEISLPHTEYAIAVYYIVATAEASANLARFDGVRYGRREVGPDGSLQSLYDLSRTHGFGPEVKRRILLGTWVLSSGYYDAYYNRALKVRTLVRRDFEAAFAKVDARLDRERPAAGVSVRRVHRPGEPRGPLRRLDSLRPHRGPRPPCRPPDPLPAVRGTPPASHCPCYGGTAQVNYLVNIGLETHVQLKTRTKMFCGCLLSTESEPNTNVCPVCLGLPGALPRANKEAVKLVVMSGLMLGCEIARHAEFARKNYFYPDMSKNYQISQSGAPLCLGGGVEIHEGGVPSGAPKRIRLDHIHLEEDAAKINHYARHSGVDYNRCGTPLMEIVGMPDLASPDEAMEYLART